MAVVVIGIYFFMSGLNKNIKLSLVGSIAPVLAGVTTVPYLYQELTAEKFGLLTLIWAMIGYFSLFDLGVGRALTYTLSAKRAISRSEISIIAASGLFMVALVGLVGGAIIFMVASDEAFVLLGVAPSDIDDAVLSFKISAAGIVLTTMNSGVRGILEGLNHFRSSNWNKSLSGALMFLGPACAVYFGANHVWVLASSIILFRAIISIGFLVGVNSIVSVLHQPCLKTVRSLVAYGGWVTVTGVVGPLMIYGDRFLVSAILGVAAVSIYAIVQEGLQRLLTIPAAVSAALLPHFAQHHHGDIRSEYVGGMRKINRVMAPVCLAVMAIAHPVLSVWLSPDFANQSINVVIILAVGIYVNSLATVPYTLLHAIGRPMITAVLHCGEVVGYILVLWILTRAYGIEGAAAAWTIRVAVDLALMHHFVNRRINQG